MVTNRSIEEAHALQRQGRAAEAEPIYRELLRQRPDAIGALEGLGVLVFQQGRTDEAAPLFARAVALHPGSARLEANLGEALRLLGRLDEALEHLRKALAVDRGFAQAWNSLGLLAFDQRRYAEAEAAYRESIRLRPRFAAAFINLGNVLQALGRGREAAMAHRAALGIEPDNPLAVINLVQVLRGLGDAESLKEAEAVGRRAADLARRLPIAAKMMEEAFRSQGQPGSPMANERPAGRDDAMAHFNRGLALMREGRHDEAEAGFREALSDDPTMAKAWVAVSQVQAERGEIEASCESARSALALSPKLAEAHWRLAITLRGRLPDAEFRAIERLVGDDTLPQGALAFLRYGLAAVLDERGEYARAAAHLEIANALQAAVLAAQGRAHDPEADAWFVDKMIATFDADLFARGRGWVGRDPRPVFVVGLPRSGTSLVEQILASHPRIHGAGELRDVGLVFKSLPELAGLIAGDSFDALKFLGPESATAAARIYLDRLNASAPPDAVRVVDKSPDNIRYLGLIALLWPGARVIVCDRDLRDIAASCWLNGFAILWIKTWEHAARRFAQYRRIVEHWRQSGAVEWLDVRYEELVGDLEGHARRLIDYVGLEWDPACLEFHSNKRVIRTPSLLQVRQPIHSRSVGRWRNYEPSLQPLFRALDRHGVEVDPDAPRSAIHHRRGLALLEESRLEDAEAAFREALRVDPTFAPSWTGLARVQAELGEFEQSCESARSAIAVSPKFGDAYWRLAVTLTGRLPDHELRAMEELVGDESLTDGAHALVRFGLAAVLDGRGRYAEAAAHLETANALQAADKAARGPAYDPDKHSGFVDRMIASFDSAMLARGRGWVNPEPRPVFVVGLPRSGTTLVEQILASHPRIHGAGELFDVYRIFLAMPQLVGQPACEPFDAVKFLGPESARAASRIYLDRLDTLAPRDATRVVDKMPDNVRLLGLIALLWPGARVIVCSRDLRDIAVSCRQAGFKTNPWSNDWDQIAQRFADNQRIMEHWRRTRPLEWLDVRYEELVGDLEGHARRLIDLVGLDWEPACLDFHLTRRAVRTPSMVQVRQPIHARSIGRWKNYEQSLGPLFRAFERHGVRVE